MKKRPARERTAVKEWLIHDAKVFLESDAPVHYFLGDFGVADVAEMPTFGTVARDIGFTFGITKDEAVFW